MEELEQFNVKDIKFELWSRTESKKRTIIETIKNSVSTPLSPGIGDFLSEDQFNHLKIEKSSLIDKFTLNLKLGEYTSEQLFDHLLLKDGAIIGGDDRIDIINIKNKLINNANIFNVDDTVSSILSNANGVVSVFKRLKTKDTHGKYVLPNQTYTDKILEKEGRPLCTEDIFKLQPAGAIATAFLIGDDLLATAGHYLYHLNSYKSNLNKFSFVFGYQLNANGTPQRTIDESNVYLARDLKKLDMGGIDWAVVKLDRKVSMDHTRLPLRASGKIEKDESVYVLGHTEGLPLKYADGAVVKDSSDVNFFKASLDTFGGNSGSPVFNSITHEVEGIYVRGIRRGKEYVPKGSCVVPLVLKDEEGIGHECTRIKLIKDAIAELSQ